MLDFSLGKDSDLFVEIMGVEFDKKTRMTRQRRVILEEIRKIREDPPSAFLGEIAGQVVDATRGDIVAFGALIENATVVNGR